MNKLVQIQNLIYVIRGQRVMLDSDLARLYEVETKVLNQAVKRNLERFPEDFMFQLTKEEYEFLRSQIVTSKSETRGGRQYFPYVFLRFINLIKYHFSSIHSSPILRV